MGYTHHYYVERAYAADTFGKTASDFAALLPALSLLNVDLAGATGAGKPTIDSRLIEFNGSGGAACEPFRLEQAVQDQYQRPAGRAPSFRDPGTGKRETNPPTVVGKRHLYTKTEHRPYDLAVTACLIIAKCHLGNGIIVCSDGSEEKWEPARRLCETTIGYGGNFRLDNV